MASLTEKQRKKFFKNRRIRKRFGFFITVMITLVFVISLSNWLILKNQSTENSKKTKSITNLYYLKKTKEIKKVEDSKEDVNRKTSVDSKSNIDGKDVQVGQSNPFDKLLNENPDTKAWLKIPDTNINYVVVQKKQQVVSNSTDYYYLYHDFYGKYSIYGTLFLDISNSVEKNFTSQNLTIYGHSMKDGQMFGQLRNYRDESYCKQHLNIDFNTIYKNGTYQIFAVLLIPAIPTQITDDTFNYMQPEFQNQKDFIEFINHAKKKSIYQIPADICEGDQILTLSTCAYDYEDARLVVMAKKVN